MSEMVQELGIALGVALLGRLTTFIYRREVLEAMPTSLPATHADAVADSLAATAAIQKTLPREVFEQAQDAFAAGLNGAAVVATLIATSLAILSVVALRDFDISGAVDAGRSSEGRQ